MLALCLHSTETRKPRHRVSASARRVPGSPHINLRFEVQGAGGSRRDELWRTTCLECFVAIGINGAGRVEYEEFNFSSSGDWAAYRFESYRAGMKLADVTVPQVNARSRVRGDVLEKVILEFEIDFSLSAEFSEFLRRPLALSLAAVMVEKSDPKPFYWALSHAGSKPDFHLRESFSLELE